MKTLLALLLITLPALAQNEPTEKKGLNYDFSYTNIGCVVNSMPDKILRLPIHKGDYGGINGESVISQKNYEMKHAFTIGYLWAKEITFDNHRHPSINLGIGLDWMIYPITAYGGDMAENTYQGHGSDIGSALTYVTLRQNGIIPPTKNVFGDFFFNLTPRAKIEFAPFGDGFNQFWIGTSVSYYTLNAQNGYDRYSNLEAENDYKLAEVIPVRVYGILFSEDDPSFGFTAGIQFQRHTKTEIGKDAKVEINDPTWFFGIGTRF